MFTGLLFDDLKQFHGTSLYTKSTSHTVKGRYSHCELVARLSNRSICKLSICGSLCRLFVEGAEIALGKAETFGCSIALLKARSPSCGSGKSYDTAQNYILRLNLV